MYVDSSRYGDLSVLVVTVVTVDGRADVVDGAALIGKRPGATLILV